MTNDEEFAQARAWAHATYAPGVDDREHALWQAEENHDFAETMMHSDELAPDEKYEDWVSEEARLADEVERLRGEMIDQWRSRDDAGLHPEVQRHAEVEQAKAWLGAAEPDALAQWQSARAHAVNADEATGDEDRVVALWQAASSDEGVEPLDRALFDSAVDEAEETRTHRLQQAQSWLKATDRWGHFNYQERRGFADTTRDAHIDDQRLVQRWLDETGGQVTPEQLRAEAADMAEAEQSLRQRVQQRVRGWMPTREQASTDEATREHGDTLEL